MDSRNDSFISRLFSRGLAIPAWLLTLIAVIAILAALLSITIPSFLWILIILVLLLIGLFPIQRGGTFKQLRGLSGHTITVSNFPPNISPELRDFSSDDDDRARAHIRDGVGEILTIAGDLVFYDENRNLVNRFPSPVRLTFDYTPEDEGRAEEHRKNLIRRGDLPANGTVEIIPVYLYTFPWDSDSPTTNIWKPFPMFSIDRSKRSMTIEFLVWGDRPVSPGTQP